MLKKINSNKILIRHVPNKYIITLVTILLHLYLFRNVEHHNSMNINYISVNIIQ